MAERAAGGDDHGAGTIGLAADVFDDEAAGAIGGALNGEAGHRPRAVGVGAGMGDHPDVAARQLGRRPPSLRRRPPRAAPPSARAPAVPAASPRRPAAGPAHRLHRRESRRTRRCRRAAPAAIAARASSRSRVAPSDSNTCAACWKWRSAVERAPARDGEPAERELADARPGSARRPARRRSSSGRCRGTPRWCAPAARAARRGAAGTRPRRPGVVRGSSRPSTCASRCSASSMRLAASSASMAISSPCSASAGGAPGDVRDLVGERAAPLRRAAPHREPRA